MGHPLEQRGAFEPFEHRALGREVGLDLFRSELRPEVGALHIVLPRDDAARALAVAMPDEVRDTQRPARVPSGRLDPEPLERALAQDPAVGDTIERHAPCETEVVEPRLPIQRPHHAQHDLLAHDLDRTGEIHLALRQVRLGDPGRPAEQLGEGPVGHGEPGEIVEVRLIERE